MTRCCAAVLAGCQLWACATIDDRSLEIESNGVSPFADAPPAGGGSGGALGEVALQGTAGSEASECPESGCAVVCPEGSHACGTECVDSSSPDSCGVSCAPCRAPTGGTATCVNGRCGGACEGGQKLCAGACIPADANCDASCPEETHDCGGLCADDFSVNSCGSACAACPAPQSGQAACDGSACGVACNGGYHECDGECVADSSVDSCGASCSPCVAPLNGQASCNGGSCGVLCNMGFHECSGQCLSNGGINSCGTACSPCVAPTGGSVSCDGQACVPACPLGQQLCAGACLPAAAACNGQCPEGTHDCSGVCLADTAVNSCGASCTPCPTPANAVATCNGTSCGVSCTNGFHDCSGQCVANTSVNSCGTTACTACPSPGANGQASCDGVRCGSVCNAGFNLCSGVQASSCSRNTFDFEGAFGVIRPDTIGTPPVTLASSLMARTGQFSAEMIVNIPANAAAAARRTGVRLAVCAAQQSTNLRLPTLSTFYFIDGPAFPIGSRIHIGFESASRGEVEYRSFEPPPRNAWIDLGGRVTLDTSDVVAIKIWVSVPTGTWTGFVYFDDIRLAPE